MDEEDQGESVAAGVLEWTLRGGQGGGGKEPAMPCSIGRAAPVEGSQV